MLISVRGTQYHQADEHFRLGHLSAGAALHLVCEPGNPHDRYAVLVKLAINRSKLGHVGRDYSQRYSELIAKGSIVSAVIKRAYRRSTGHLTIECIVEYRHDDDDSPSLSYVWHVGIEHVSGVYEICNLSNGCCYIGSAKDVKTRALQHERELHRRSHHNAMLQRDFDHGGIGKFRFSLVRGCSERRLHSEEASEILERRTRGHGLYNATDDGQGLAFKPSPNHVTATTILSPVQRSLAVESSPRITSVSTSESPVVLVVVALIVLILLLAASK